VDARLTVDETNFPQKTLQAVRSSESRKAEIRFQDLSILKQEKRERETQEEAARTYLSAACQCLQIATILSAALRPPRWCYSKVSKFLTRKYDILDPSQRQIGKIRHLGTRLTFFESDTNLKDVTKSSILLEISYLDIS